MTEYVYKKFTNASKEMYGSFKCPNCGLDGMIDEDQAFGRISIQCPNEDCTFHETINLESA